MNKLQFKGPVFIVGFPRSGTKLLRDLLNRNPCIGIPVSESHFIPFMIKKFGFDFDFSKEDNLRKFYYEFQDTTLFTNMNKLGYHLTWEYLSKNSGHKDWCTILEVIFRFYAPIGRAKDFIWGDKTPGYINHIKLLKRLFPKSKFIHIIRDPRDCCLSVKKAWGKSIYRAAERWRQSIEYSHAISIDLNDDYHEIFYESLLKNPEKIMSNICKIIDCEYSSQMITLANPVESFGDTKNSTAIVASNLKKYYHLSKYKIKRIEEIVCPVAKSLGYKFENDIKFKPLNSFEIKVYKLYDGYASLTSHIREKGLKQGVDFFRRLYFRSAWRKK